MASSVWMFPSLSPPLGAGLSSERRSPCSSCTLRLGFSPAAPSSDASATPGGQDATQQEKISAAARQSVKEIEKKTKTLTLVFFISVTSSCSFLSCFSYCDWFFSRRACSFCADWSFCSSLFMELSFLSYSTLIFLAFSSVPVSTEPGDEQENDETKTLRSKLSS